MSNEAKNCVKDLRFASESVRIGRKLYAVAADLIERQATALAEIATLHVPLETDDDDDDASFCATCDDEWPCATAAAVPSERGEAMSEPISDERLAEMQARCDAVSAPCVHFSRRACYQCGMERSEWISEYVPDLIAEVKRLCEQIATADTARERREERH